MPIIRNHKKDLHLSLPLASSWNSVLNVNKPNSHHVDMNRTCDVTLNDHEARAIRGENSDCMDDLMSECSTPCSTLYTPGKYLQLCDLDLSETRDDVTLFSVSSQSHESDLEDLPLWNTQRHLDLSLKNPSSIRQVVQMSTKSRLFPLISNKTLLIVALCMIVAFTALGCLTTVI